MNIKDIEGMNEDLATKLASAGVKLLEDLIKLSKKDVSALAKKTGIPQKTIDTWQEHADMIRIKGIGVVYADLLNLVGVDSVKELATRVPKNLFTKVEQFLKEHPGVVQKVPTLADIEKWVAEAKKIK